MDYIAQYPFEFFVAVCVVTIALTKGLGWAVFTMYALMAIALFIKTQGFDGFATGLVAGVVANEITHIIRKKWK